MFWDGNRWVDESPASQGQARNHPHSALTAWIATGVMIVMGLLIALPMHQADADAAELVLSPSSGTAGSQVAVRATGIPSGTAVVLQWDGAALGGEHVSGGSGKLNTRITVPNDSTGTHQIALVTTEGPAKKNGNGRPAASQRALAHGIVLASVAFTLLPLSSPATTETPAVVTASPTAAGTPVGQLATPTPVGTPLPTTATAAPTTAPTPNQSTPAPTAPPTPAATPATTPAPTVGCTVTFGGSANGSTDVTSALQTFLRNAPAGATACMAPGGQYLVNGTVQIPARDNGLTIEGNGARWFATVRRNNAMLRFDSGGRNLMVRNLTIEGYNPNGRTSNAHDYSWEFGMGISLYGVANTSITNVRILNVNGDGIYMSGANTSSGFRWADGITVSGLLIDGTGRNGIAMTDGVRNVTVRNSTLRYTGLYAFDLEPNGTVVGGVTVGVDHLTITGNTISHYTIDSDWGPYLFAASGLAPESDLEFSNNVVIGQRLHVAVQPNGYARTNIRILNNRSDTRVAGPVMEFAGCNGLTVTGNVQPLSSGQLASVSGCTNVNISNNNTN